MIKMDEVTERFLDKLGIFFWGNANHAIASIQLQKLAMPATTAFLHRSM